MLTKGRVILQTSHILQIKSPSRQSTHFIFRFFAALLMITAVSFLAGCQSEDFGLREPVKIAGSTTIEPIIRELGFTFSEEHPEIDLSVRGGGSTIGVKGVAYEALHIGMISRQLSAAEASDWPSLVVTPIGYDGIAVVVSQSLKQNGIRELSISQIQQIWSGEISNWQELDGPDLPIRVYNRSGTSGTQATFEELVIGERVENAEHFAGLLGESEDVLRVIAEEPGSISILSAGLQTSDVSGVAIAADGEAIAPTSETVSSGEYPISRTLNLLTNGAPEGIVAEFISFVLSSEGQQALARSGFSTISE